MKLLVIIYLLSLYGYDCEVQFGPDPWSNPSTQINNEFAQKPDIPPDLQPVKKVQPDNTIGLTEIYYRRLLGLLLKGEHVTTDDNESVHINFKMKFHKDRFNTIDKHLSTNVPLSEEILRRSLGYVEEAIYKQSFTEKIIIAWSEYFKYYFIEYREYFIWTIGIFGAGGLILWLWSRLSHGLIIKIMFILLYLYEVFISYKEAEQKDYETFVSAIDKCKWYFWMSNCDIPKPDPILFLKHMNPMKIAIRMFTNFITEPVIAISEIIKVMLGDITDGLWFPFNRIIYAILIVVVYLLLLFFILTVIFNFILNIPFQINMFAGIFSVGIQQRRRGFERLDQNQQRTDNSDQSNSNHNSDRISGETLNRFLDIVSHALNRSSSNESNTRESRPLLLTNTSRDRSGRTIKRSASTGRLPNLISSIENTSSRVIRRRPENGSGDA